MNEHADRGAHEQDRRRQHLGGSIDPQVLQTRRQLSTAFQTAAKEQVQRLSVRWLCASAGIARSTFYSHFSSVEDLTAFVLTEHLDDLAATNLERRSSGTPERSSRVELRRTIELLQQRQPLLDYAFSTQPSAIVMDGMVQWLASYVSDSVRAAYPGSSEAQLLPIVDFISAGAIRAVLQWLRAPSPLTVEELVVILEQLLPDPLR